MALANETQMGIQDFQKAIEDGNFTADQVVRILDERIARRKAAGKALVARVVSYRNELAESINKIATVQVPIVAVPTYAKAKANPALPSDPEQLADVVFATVGAAGIGNVITRLTARMIGVH